MTENPAYNPTEIWWPHPSAFDDLTVDFEDEESGGAIIHLSAPDGTECADWLQYFQETPERKAAFEREFLKSLLQHIQRLEDGQTEIQPDEQSSDCVDREENSTGTVEAHDPLIDLS